MPPETLTAFYDSHARALYRFLLSLTASEPDTRDLLQDLFVKLARHPGPAPHDPQAYLFRAARNAFIDLIKRRDRRRHVMFRYQNEQEPAHLAEAEGGTMDPGAAIAHALACLPEEQRAVVHLKIWENLTFVRIGEILTIPANTAASRYRYAMDRLRQILPHPISHHAP